MPRVARVAPGGVVFHVLNRANGRLRLFKKDEDYQAFERVFAEAHARCPIRVLDWCLMSNHWHMVLWPRADGELTQFMRWLTLTHAQRWKHAHGAVGHGHLYQGRFKSFPVQSDEHLLTLMKYVERNPLRARLAPRARDWPWGSCHVRQLPAAARAAHPLGSIPCAWPIDSPRDWAARVDAPMPDAVEQHLRTCIARGQPFGSEAWVRRTASTLNLAATLRPRGRQRGWRKQPENGGN